MGRNRKESGHNRYKSGQKRRKSGRSGTRFPPSLFHSINSHGSVNTSFSPSFLHALPIRWIKLLAPFMLERRPKTQRSTSLVPLPVFPNPEKRQVFQGRRVRRSGKPRRAACEASLPGVGPVAPAVQVVLIGRQLGGLLLQPRRIGDAFNVKHEVADRGGHGSGMKDEG